MPTPVAVKRMWSFNTRARLVRSEDLLSLKYMGNEPKDANSRSGRIRGGEAARFQEWRGGTLNSLEGSSKEGGHLRE